MGELAFSYLQSLMSCSLGAVFFSSDTMRKTIFPLINQHLANPFRKIVFLILSFFGFTFFWSQDLDQKLLNQLDLQNLTHQDDTTADPNRSTTLYSIKTTTVSNDRLKEVLPKVTFVCDGKDEGYFADLEFCDIFHFCKV